MRTPQRSRPKPNSDGSFALVQVRNNDMTCTHRLTSYLHITRRRLTKLPSTFSCRGLLRRLVGDRSATPRRSFSATTATTATAGVFAVEGDHERDPVAVVPAAVAATNAASVV